jgi:hypothetical protein
MRHIREKTEDQIVSEYINKMHRIGTMMRVFGCSRDDRLQQARFARSLALSKGGDADAIKAMFSAYFLHGELSDGVGQLELVK